MRCSFLGTVCLGGCNGKPQGKPSFCLVTLLGHIPTRLKLNMGHCESDWNKQQLGDWLCLHSCGHLQVVRNLSHNLEINRPDPSWLRISSAPRLVSLLTLLGIFEAAKHMRLQNGTHGKLLPESQGFSG